jgi:hypothetical protein
MIDIRNIQEDNLHGTNWIGEVVDIEDPTQEGRIRVKVFGKFDELEPETIPWASPRTKISGGSATGSGSFSVPKLGSIVGIIFENGELGNPEWYTIEHISDELKEEISGSYANAHSLIYDTVTEGFVKVFFTEAKGLMLDYKQTQVNIKPNNSVVIQNPNGDIIEITNEGKLTITVSDTVEVNCKKAIIDAKSIELGAGAVESLILGNSFKAVFDTHTHAGPNLPPSVPLPTGVLSKISKTK